MLAPGMSTRASAAEAEPQQPRGSLDREAQRAHGEWLQRGRTGPGQFDVVGVFAREAGLGATTAIAGKFDGVDFRDANFQHASWDEVDLLRCNLSSVAIASASFNDARIMDCTFAGSGGKLAHFERATIYGTSFDKANLDCARIDDALVTSSSFTSAWFGNATWDRARFKRCNFRDASFESFTGLPVTTMRNTLFEGCDFRGVDFTRTNLRGASFRGCKFGGARGVPRSMDDLTVIDADFSEAGDGSASGGEEELRKQLWRNWSAAELGEWKQQLLIARDRTPGEDRTLVFDLVDAGVSKRIRLLGTTTDTVTASSVGPVKHGFGVGTSGFAWSYTDEAFEAWMCELAPFSLTRTELKTAGGVRPVASLTSVALFREDGQRGRRGVLVRIPEGALKRLVLIQEHDFVADDDPTYPDEAVRRDEEWTRQLASDLARWLGVPYEDEHS